MIRENDTFLMVQICLNDRLNIKFNVFYSDKTQRSAHGNFVVRVATQLVQSMETVEVLKNHL